MKNMDQRLITFLVFQLIIIGTLLIFVGIFIKETQAIKFEKRFLPFTLLPKEEEEISIFDSIAMKIWNLIHVFSKLLKKFPFVNKYGERYDRFIPFEEKNDKSGIDYISIKCLVGLFFVVLKTITVAFHYTSANFLSYLLPFCIGFFLPDLLLHIRFSKKQRQIADDLLKAIIMMNNSFKSGRSIMQAIELVKEELNGPIADEFKKIYVDITYGLSLDVVFNRFYERVKLEDAKYIASSLTLINKTGGNIIRIFTSIEKSILDKKRLRNELNSLTAASLFMFRLLVFLPFLFVFVISILNPTYFKPLYTTKIGICVLVFIFLLYSLYILLIKRVLKVKMK